MPVFLYGFVTWSQTVEKVRVLEGGVPRRIFGRIKDEISVVEETEQ